MSTPSNLPTIYNLSGKKTYSDASILFHVPVSVRGRVKMTVQGGSEE